ncbi:MAG: hypothetical protein RR065_10805 [Clostridia bacterium]
MLRKSITLLLCLLLTLLAPLGALAAAQYTFTIVPGDDLAAIPAVKDTLDILSLKLLRGEGAYRFTLNMGDEDVISAAMRADDKGIYVKSDAFSADALFLAWADIAAMAEKAFIAMGNDAQIAAEFKQQILAFGAAMGSLSTEVANAQEPASALLPQTADEKLEILHTAFADDAEMIAWITDIANRVVTTDGDFTDATHDAATQKTVLAFTGEDYVKLLNTQYCKNLIATAATESGEPDDVVESEKLIDSIKDFFTKSTFELPITVYTADDGKTLISISIPFAMKGVITLTDDDGEVENENVDIGMQMSYNRLTTEAGVTHKGEVKMSEEGKLLATVVADLLSKPDSSKTGSLMMLVDDGMQITLAYDQTPIEGGFDRSFAIYSRADATAPVAPSASDRPLITFNLQTATVDSDADLSALAAATAETATQPLTMDDDALKAFLTDATARLSQVMYSIMANVPSSLLTFVSGINQATTPTEAQ